MMTGVVYSVGVVDPLATIDFCRTYLYKTLLCDV